MPTKVINNIILVGFMGTGKTTVGKLLAANLLWTYIDTDTLIEQQTRMKISAIFSRHGESYFRDVESVVIREVMQHNQQIVSTGGGIVFREENISVMKSNGIIVCLTAAPKIIYERTKSDEDRPLLKVENPLLQIRELLAVRSLFYAKADITIDTTNISPENIVQQLLLIAKKLTG